MKKTIRKPENWQDFESLCKKLWGEVWDIPMKIKKNGRNGQPQAGVDVYGVPKGETNYWGIQCKGKDDYTNAQLSKKEIDTEIENAKSFKPKLEVFIFATSMNKDSKIEEYVRIKDVESRENGGFEILLYCWEDITDLLEENPDTLNSYLTGNNIKSKYDLDVYFDGVKRELDIAPKFLKKSTKYRVIKQVEDDLTRQLNQLLKPTLNLERFAIPSPFFGSNKINRSWCKIEFIIHNCGNVVIEDWRVRFWFDNNVSKIDDDHNTSYLLSTEVMLEIQRNRTTFAYPEDNLIVYSPRNNGPLIQKDKVYVEAYIIPHFEVNSINIKWELLARDFNKEGNLTLNVIPELKEKTTWIDVESEEDKLEDEVEYEELIEDKK